MWWAVVVVLPGLLRGQSPPCLNCETYVEENNLPLSSQNGSWNCSDNGCQREEGEICDPLTPCENGLSCQYTNALATTGRCREIKGLPCTVFNQTYENGKNFMLDCRTQCTCKNGRYACASLCPKENISPLGISCMHPRLVEIPGQCCREWMCDGHSAERPPDCEWSPWSACPDSCGAGLSRRMGPSPLCQPNNETRLCQLRPCPGPLPQKIHNYSQHRLRKGHECKATRRLGRGVRLRFASCLSVKRYRPKWCGACQSLLCLPELSTTIKVPMLCQQPEDTVEDVTQGSDLWGSIDRKLTPAYSHPITVQVEWISKCECSPLTITTRIPEMLLHRVHRTAAP